MKVSVSIRRPKDFLDVLREIPYYSALAKRALRELFDKYSKSIIVLSYSSNCYPSWQQLYLMLKKEKRIVEIHRTSYTYSFGNQGFKNDNNHVYEYLFIAR